MIRSLNPFVNSGLGQLEFELCKLLGKTPREIGELREKDPLGIKFLEECILWRKKKELEALKKAEQKAKASRLRRK